MTLTPSAAHSAAKLETSVPQSTKFWDRIADRYARKPVSDEAAYQQKLKVTQSYLRPDMEVLEFGCGTGTTALIHAPFVKHIRAIDFSRRMIEIAQAKAEAAKVTNVTFEQAAIDDLEVPDASYDVVQGHSILHLLEDRDAVIAKVHRMLKPGGLFVSSTVCLGDRMKFFKFIGPIGKFFGLMPLVRVITKQELRDSLINAGFAIDHDWEPETAKSISLFIVARKAA